MLVTRGLGTPQGVLVTGGLGTAVAGPAKTVLRGSGSLTGTLTASGGGTGSFVDAAALLSGLGSLSGTSSLSTKSLWTNSFMGVPDGTVVSAGNSGGVSGDPFTLVLGTNTVRTSSDLTGAFDRGVSASVTAAADAMLGWTVGTAATVGYLRTYFRVPSLPPATVRIARAMASGGSTMRWEVRISTTGRVIMARTDGQFLAQTGDAVITPGTAYRVEAGVSGTTAVLNVYTGEGTTALPVTYPVPYDSGPWTAVRFGVTFSAAQTYAMDHAAVGYSSTALLGPEPSGASFMDAAATLVGAGTASAGLSAAVTARATVAGSGAVQATIGARLRASSTLQGFGQATGAARLRVRVMATVTGSGTVTTPIKATHRASATLAGSGSVTATGKLTKSLASSLSGSGSVSSTLRGRIRVTAQPTGSSTVTGGVKARARAATTLTGVGTVTAAGKLYATAWSTLSGLSTLTATGSAAIVLRAVADGSGDLAGGLAVRYGRVTAIDAEFDRIVGSYMPPGGVLYAGHEIVPQVRAVGWSVERPKATSGGVERPVRAET